MWVELLNELQLNDGHIPVVLLEMRTSSDGNIKNGGLRARGFRTQFFIL